MRNMVGLTDVAVLGWLGTEDRYSPPSSLPTSFRPNPNLNHNMY